MKKPITTIDELYARQEPTGEVILDEVVYWLRHSRVMRSKDLADAMGVKHYQLQAAVRMLTGMSLHELISGWRRIQAQELLQANGMCEENASCHSETQRRTPRQVMRQLDEGARRCGWTSAKAMKRSLKR